MLTSSIEVNQTFTASLHNVVFREVSVDQETYESTPINGGKTWCVDSVNVSALIEAM